jgi:DNA-binding NtrC family response regulator
MEEALATLGHLEIAGERKAAALIQREKYKIIIIDATHTKNLPALLSLIRERHHSVDVVIVTASPDWREARLAFRLGAMDYIYGSMTAQDLRSSFRGILQHSLKLVS